MQIGSSTLMACEGRVLGTRIAYSPTDGAVGGFHGGQVDEVAQMWESKHVVALFFKCKVFGPRPVGRISSLARHFYNLS